MKQVRDQIKNDVQDCKSKGERFHMPSFDRDDVIVKESILKPCGLTRYKSKYRISLGKVTSSDPSLNFTEEWDEKA